MTSRDSIKNELVNIATQHGYRGEMVEIAADLLSYVLYHNQVEITNAVQESSLSTAKLMNSKITECMNVMYSVYRGKSTKVILNFKSNTFISKNKYDLVYESNTFKLYAADNYSIIPSTSNTDYYQLECIFCTGTKYEYDVTITEDNQYYIDLLDSNGHPQKDLSEDIKITIDGIEYPTTRNFFDHINSVISNGDDAADLDQIFVLTIPDFGVRLFKKGYKDTDGTQRGYFKIGSVVHVESFKYTKWEEINQNEYSKILIPGTELIPFTGVTLVSNDTNFTLRGKVTNINDLPSASELNLYDAYVVAQNIYGNAEVDEPNPDYLPPEQNPVKIDGISIRSTTQTTSATSKDFIQLANEVGTIDYKIQDILNSSNLLPDYGKFGDAYIVSPYDGEDSSKQLFVYNPGVSPIPFSEVNIAKSLIADLINNFDAGYDNIKFVGTGNSEYGSVFNDFGTKYYYVILNNKEVDWYVKDTDNTGAIFYTTINGITTANLLYFSSVGNYDYLDDEHNQPTITEIKWVNLGSVDDYSEVTGITGRQSIKEISRDDSNAILYNANSSTRIQNQILSNSDVSIMFTEFFIDTVLNSVNRYCPKGVRQGINVDVDSNSDRLFIFYLPRVVGEEISASEVEVFKSKYQSYFITTNILAYSAALVTVDVSIELTLNTTEQITDSVTEIFSQYENVLTSRSEYTESDIVTQGLDWDYDYYSQLVNLSRIYAQVAKINEVVSINRLSFIKFTTPESSSQEGNYEKLPSSIEIGSGTKVRVPVYYKFNLNISYKNIYETVS